MLTHPVKNIVWRGVAQGAQRLAFAWKAVVRGLRKHSAGAEIRRLESRKLDKFQEMGRIVYQMYLEDRVRTKRLRGLCETVARLEACSRDVEGQLTRMTSQAVAGPPPAESSQVAGAPPG